MNIPGFTTTALLMLHGTIQAALTFDDSLPAGQEKAYGAREFLDWRTMSDEFEQELDKRHVSYEKIAW